MTVYESLTLMISFSSLVVLVISLSFTFTKKK
ncbi:putative holin-like toxin [Lysinibacillus xylanilyticus]|nr:putative holin-like toxin [Lysinibacillus xylanilyticus]MEB2280134.1 putative holin-like toxin [Lysinibacillus xylanilyticus]